MKLITTHNNFMAVFLLGLLCLVAVAVEPVSAIRINVRKVAAAAGTEAQVVAESDAVRVNPAVERYRQYTLQYLEDAKEAAAAAKHYDELIKAATPGVVAETSVETKKELTRINAPVWGHATWEIEKMLENKAPARAAAAAAKAAAPFMKAAGEYQKAQTAYDGAAQGYALRVGMDQDAAKKLQSYANQYELEGNKEMAQTYGTQASLLMKQAENYRDTAVEYNKMALRLNSVINTIQADAGKAGAYAAYPLNPGNSMPPEHVFPFTVAPPFEVRQANHVV